MADLPQHLAARDRLLVYEYESTGEETSFRNLHDPDSRSLIQLAIGAGKTFTASQFSWRLLKHAHVHRILLPRIATTSATRHWSSRTFIRSVPPAEECDHCQL